MSGLKFDRFSGIIPRAPESLLPPINASAAVNCEFAFGELRAIKGDFLSQTMVNTPVSLYTDNGLTFYSWTEDVNAVRSPLAHDTFDRLYYTTPTDFRVTTRSNMAINGGAPTSSYRVGVPKPTVAPTLTVPAAPGLDTATIVATFQYEYAGVKYQEAAITLTTVTANKKWTFTPPAKSVTPLTPLQAFPVIHLVATDGTTHDVLFDLYTANSSAAMTGDWALAIAQNTDGTSYSITLTSSVLESDKKTRAYVYTYVNTYGEEGPPSPPATITALSKLAFTVGCTRDAQTVDYAPIKEIRIYRTPDDSDIADYFYTGSIQVLTAGGTAFQFIDTVTAAALNEPLASMDYYPPDIALVGLMSLPNGILIAWKDNEVHVSDAYKPWSWPPRYIKTAGHSIVGGLPHGAGALITTRAKPFFISGVSPDSMTESPVNIKQAGVSKWSMVDIDGMAAYASNDGIVVIDGGQATLAFSEQFFTRDVWRARCAAGFSTMRFAAWDGRLIVWSSTNAFTPFMVRLDEAKGAMTDIPGLVAGCSYVSPVGDQLYYARSNVVYQFAGGSDTGAAWTSREIVLAAPANFGIAQAICSGAWSVSFLADGVIKHTKVLTGNATFRLPAGFESDRWKISISGNGRFRELRVATTVEELKKM